MTVNPDKFQATLLDKINSDVYLNKNITIDKVNIKTISKVKTLGVHMHKLLHGAKGNVANILRASHILQILIYILTFSVNLHQINDGRIKQKDLYHRNFFYTMLYSDAHFVLQGDLTR